MTDLPMPQLPDEDFDLYRIAANTGMQVVEPNEDIMPLPSLEDATVSDFGDTVEVDFDPAAQEPATVEGLMGRMIPHDANLADYLDETMLARMAEELIEDVIRDEESSSEFRDLFNRGLEVCGLADEERDAETGTAPFKGASKVRHPLILEAAIQFQSRAIAELFPPTGPAKAVVVGRQTPEKEDQRERVENYMNYHLTEEDEGYYTDHETMLFWLPIVGCGFKKVWHNSIKNMNQARWISHEDVIINYTATSAMDAPRITHRYRLTLNDTKKEQFNGTFREYELMQPSDEDGDPAETDSTLEVRAARDKLDRRTKSMSEKDPRLLFYEVHTDYDLEGFEHRDSAGEKTSIGLPYIITVDVEARTISSIYRNWREGDNTYQKRNWFVQYMYIPGPGVYGMGLIHAIGELNEAATGAVRALLDSAARNNAQGGFKSKDAKLPAGQFIVKNGVWQDVNCTADDLSKAFFTIPTKEPSPALFKLLEILISAGQRFASTTEQVVGDAANTGPVGTTVALIEQAMKIFSAIHKRCHNAQKQELRLLAELHYEYMPDEGYPYEVVGESREIFREDFDERVDIIPVSDPNISSVTQRIAVAQGDVQLAEKFPQFYDMYKVLKRMHKAMGSQDTDEILIDPSDIKRMDPVTENMAMMTGKPVKAFEDQNHQAHIMAHLAFMQHPGFGGNPEVQKVVMGTMMAHLAEHVAYQYRVNMLQAGIQLPPVDISMGNRRGPLEEELPPEIEDQIAVMAAQATPLFMQMMGLPVPQAPQPEGPSEAEVKNKAHEDDEARKHKSWENNENRKNMSALNDMERESAVSDYARKLNGGGRANA